MNKGIMQASKESQLKKPDPKRAKLVMTMVDAAILKLAEAEVSQAEMRTQIGLLLNETREGGYWRDSFDSFGSYMESLEKKYNLGKTQLYAYAGIVRDLLPEVGAEKLTEMGLEKAKLIRQAKNNSGSLPDSKIIDAATDKNITIGDFRQMLLDEKKIPDQPRDGKHRSIEYFADEELHKSILEGIALAEEGVDAQQPEVKRGIALGDMAAEFRNTYPKSEKF